MPTNHDETLTARYQREHDTHLATLAKMTPEQIHALELDLHNALAEIDRLNGTGVDGWPTDDMVIRGAEELHDSLRLFGIDINFDTCLRGTEIQQEIAAMVFQSMLAAAPKQEGE